MAIEIIVEDGTGKANSNSYVSIADLISFAALYQTELTDDDSTASLLIQAADYIESKSYKGSKANSNQAMKWPRKEAYINCEDDEELYPSNSIPVEIKKAQLQCALAVSNGVSLMPTVTAADYVLEETIGPITTKYADAAEYGLSYAPNLPIVDSLLSCLTNSNRPGLFRTVRGGYG
ncbi:head-to-tail adaptor [Erwinia phage AH03]|uniref:Head-to-tail adaptor n=1 Tax=Erwinia phage AH03 TaxID=2869568 RepID=A0AAE8BPZ2_9CAUD|nr:head-to-tail adaptor [Erwinia phage AH03]